jgi:hypothetical protein
MVLMSHVTPCDDHPNADKHVEKAKEYKIRRGRVTDQVDAHVYTVRCAKCGRVLSEERREVAS